MPWRVVERKIGLAGRLQQRTARQREWDAKYGEDNCEIGYLIEGEFVSQTEAIGKRKGDRKRKGDIAIIDNCR